MVEIALADLPIKLVSASHISQLIAQEKSAPALLICAQRLGDHARADRDSYLDQSLLLLNAGFRCPLLILLDQKSTPITESSALTLIGSVRKPFKTQALVEVVAQSLKLEVPHAELFDESQRVIPLARSSNSAVTADPLQNIADTHQDAMRPKPTEVKTPSPSSVGSLLDAVTPVQRRPQSANPSVSSSELVTRRPESSPVSEVDPSGTNLSTHDLSPFPTTEDGQSQRPVSSSNLSQISTPLQNLTPKAHPLTRSGQPSDSPPPPPSVSITQSSPHQSTANQTSLGGDWLDPHQESHLPTPQEDTQETAVDLAPLSAGEEIHLPVAAQATSEVNATAFETVRLTTERAFTIIQRVGQQNAARVTPEEMRVLIERVAWEVVPAIATELLRAEIAKNTHNSIKS